MTPSRRARKRQRDKGQSGSRSFSTRRGWGVSWSLGRLQRHLSRLENLREKRVRQGTDKHVVLRRVGVAWQPDRVKWLQKANRFWSVLVLSIIIIHHHHLRHDTHAGSDLFLFLFLLQNPPVHRETICKEAVPLDRRLREGNATELLGFRFRY
ncbi:hypothetical protein B0F90DRAFT_323495 [Multifurca ochricompacta]|uniref:Uncharacterized protein n=1 Tax=Multifurca ochricompacta TaxID=376703 RepID=A0AAD4M4A5_9AGAM|nr:hypothetical protein B0F90DRAFT_323495 [Multifurca ochricompacta]